MLERIYIAFWGVYFLAVALFWIAGLMNPVSIVVLGVTAFGMIFLGMIGVLPFVATHHSENQH